MANKVAVYARNDVKYEKFAVKQELKWESCVLGIVKVGENSLLCSFFTTCDAGIQPPP